MKKTRQRIRCGTQTVVPVLRWKTRKYGRITAERVMSVKRDWLLFGAQQSGKTRWLNRLQSDASGVWRGRECYRVSALSPIGALLDDPRISTWHERQPNALPWRALKSWDKQASLIAWAEETHPVLLIDDAHTLAGRKADVCVHLIRAASVCITTATSEGRIPVSVRLALQQREPERIDLRSDAPADMTAILVWVLVVISCGAGAWQIAAALGGLRLLASGSRASKQGS